MTDALRKRLGESAESFRAVFSNVGLRRIELSWAGFVTGTWAYTVALAVFAYDAGGASAVGLMGLIRVLPATVAAPFAAGLGDRYRRERVLLLAGLLRIGLVGGAAAAVFADVPVGLVYAAAGVEALAATVFRPLQTAILPSLARNPQELTAANLSLTTIESVGMFAGPAIGGVLLAVTSTEVTFGVTAGIFTWAVFLVSRVGMTEPPEAVEVKGWGAGEAFAGFRIIAGDRRLRLLVGLYGAQTLVDGALNVLIVVSALELLELGQSGVGFLNSAIGVGGFVGGLVALLLIGRQRLASDFGYGLVLWGIPIALLGVFPEPPAAIILMVVLGIGVTLVDVAAVTLLQRVVPDEVLARVFGVLQSIFVGTVGLGAIIAPLLIDAVGIRAALLVTGAFLPIMAALFWRKLSALNAEGIPATRQIGLLRETPIFAPLPAATIEHLAESLVPVRVSAGDTVFRQGDQGDRFYIVGEGEVQVSVDGRDVPPLGKGAYFGEIALLRDVPRTATVAARTDVELYALEREEFLAAVTGHTASAEAADAVVSERLAGQLRRGLGSV